jgi:serine/threonine protein kinase
MPAKPIAQEKSSMRIEIDSQASVDSGTGGSELCPPAVAEKGYRLGAELGSGAFSKVYEASNEQKPGVRMACKRFDLTDRTQEVWREKCLKSEMKIIMKLNHKNIIKGYEVIKTRRSAFIFMGFARNGNVGSYLERTTKAIEEPKSRKWIHDILSGLAYLHSKGIAHRDLKPENFLLDNDFKDALLADFGFSCVASEDQKLMKGTNCGTDVYKAPELLGLREGHVYDAKKSDIFSMGVSLFEMLQNRKPFGNEVAAVPAFVRKQTSRGYEYHKSIKMSRNCKECCDLLLEPLVTKRVTAEEALKLIWFRD